MTLFFQSLDPLVVSLLMFPLYCLLILFFHRFFGATGVIVFLVVAVIGANLQVLKLSFFSLYNQPVALGTALFSSTYFCTDLLCEHYGKRKAIKAAIIGLMVMPLWTIITYHAIIYAPLTAEQSGGNYDWALGSHDHMVGLFSIVPSITIASFLAFAVSQFNDVFLFDYVKKKTQGRYLFLRNNVSTFISVLIDNAVFSFVAFYLLAPNPVPIKALIFSYILSTYVLRLLFAVLDTPFLYLSKCQFFLPRKKVTPDGS